MTEQEDIEVVESHLSDEAAEYAANYIGEDVQMGAIAVPPVPRDKVEDVVDEYEDGPDDDFNNPLKGHLFDLTDLTLAINHSGDPMLDSSVEDDEDPYCVERESVAEIKIARGALFSAFNRELAACARRLDIDPDEHDDLVNAIREEVGYSVDVSVDEDWSASEDDLDDALDE